MFVLWSLLQNVLLTMMSCYQELSATTSCMHLKRTGAECYYAPEEDKVHGLLADVVVLLQVVLHHQLQLLHVLHLCVRPGTVLWVHKVTEHEATQIILLHNS